MRCRRQSSSKATAWEARWPPCWPLWAAGMSLALRRLHVVPAPSRRLEGHWTEVAAVVQPVAAAGLVAERLPVARPAPGGAPFPGRNRPVGWNPVRRCRRGGWRERSAPLRRRACRRAAARKPATVSSGLLAAPRGRLAAQASMLSGGTRPQVRWRQCNPAQRAARASAFAWSRCCSAGRRPSSGPPSELRTAPAAAPAWRDRSSRRC